MSQKSNLVAHAEKELDILMGGGAVSLDGMDAAMKKDILAIVKTFSKQGHSGYSAAYATGILEKLLRFEPITPLTGEDSEWVMVTELGGWGINKETYQNIRCSRVFKEGIDGQAYDVEGKVFVDKDGSSWTNSKSHTPVTFPYVPKTVRVQRRWWKFWL